MELKQFFVVLLLPFHQRLNCTVMELKQRTNTSDNRAIVRLNCTVMELKRSFARQMIGRQKS